MAGPMNGMDQNCLKSWRTALNSNCHPLLAMAFPDNTLIKGLNISLQSDDEDTRDMAMLSLKMITEEYKTFEFQ